jgi:hypothetical protein
MFLLSCPLEEQLSQDVPAHVAFLCGKLAVLRYMINRTPVQCHSSQVWAVSLQDEHKKLVMRYTNKLIIQITISEQR